MLSQSPDPHFPYRLLVGAVQMPWEEGLRSTVEWYKKYTSRYGNIESALVPHPCNGAPVAVAGDVEEAT